MNTHSSYNGSGNNNTGIFNTIINSILPSSISSYAHTLSHLASQSILLTDISDIRPGTHSYGFVTTDSTYKHAQVSICVYVWVYICI